MIGVDWVSVLFNEPKLLKSSFDLLLLALSVRFSALQRAEIAEIVRRTVANNRPSGGFSALQRAEIAEMKYRYLAQIAPESFSALQRAEIAEIK